MPAPARTIKQRTEALVLMLASSAEHGDVAYFDALYDASGRNPNGEGNWTVRNEIDDLAESIKAFREVRHV